MSEEIIVVPWSKEHINDFQDWLEQMTSPGRIVHIHSEEYGTAAPMAGGRTLMNKLRLYLRRALFGEDLILLKLEEISVKLDKMTERNTKQMADLNQVVANLTQQVAQAQFCDASPKVLPS